MLKAFLSLLAVAVLSGCASQSLSQYEDQGPEFVPEQFFNGPLKAYGMVTDRSGAVTRRFVADIDAYWVDGVGTLDEFFVWSDGEEQTRIWTLTPNNDGSYAAVAGDVVAPTTMRVAGNALQMKYQLLLPFGDGEIAVTMDDWMYLITDDTLINRTNISKFGYNLGEVILTIQQQ